ncbi:L-dopachrome tautomerase yellow-f-like [Wyeomyia smithii]|uniref:L-dopachrome tautomerase yellow-f-like n=1 Tax=Wyeomyia smithii TaxID=174621 RepID=UPI00246816B3|nr:L-dopachrome tautomerase yellow-f-like [Wyeomyia smithii]
MFSTEHSFAQSVTQSVRIQPATVPREMKTFLSILIVLLVQGTAEELKLAYQWTQLSAPILDNNVSTSNQMVQRPAESFNAYGNVPMGLSHHKGRLFVTFPRRNPGIPATLTVINMLQFQGVNNPPVSAYPDGITNTLQLNYTADPMRIVSVYRTKVDKCDRLWFVDTGYLEYPNNERQVQRPALWIIDLRDDRVLQRFEIPTSIVERGFGMVSITVDVEADRCDQAYAYISDYQWQGLYVYSLATNRMWRFSHIFFSFEPRNGRFNLGGLRFVWNDGLFSIAIGERIRNSANRMVYLHAMAATSEIAVSNSVLNNETLSRSATDFNGLFLHLGSRGPNTHSANHAYDERTGVLFYTEVNRNSIGCWNSALDFNADNHGLVHMDNEKMIYPSDLTIDNDGVMWVMSNRFPLWLYYRLNVTDFNFRIWRQTGINAIKGTICV